MTTDGQTTFLLHQLQTKNNRETGGILEQKIMVAEPVSDSPSIPCIERGTFMPLTPMLFERFNFAGTWTNGAIVQTWLSITDMVEVWESLSIISQINLRRIHWPRSLVAQYPLARLSLLGVDAIDNEEVYLVWTGPAEPEVVSFFEGQEDRFDNFNQYLKWLIE